MCVIVGFEGTNTLNSIYYSSPPIELNDQIPKCSLTLDIYISQYNRQSYTHKRLMCRGLLKAERRERQEADRFPTWLTLHR